MDDDGSLLEAAGLSGRIEVAEVLKPFTVKYELEFVDTRETVLP